MPDTLLSHMAETSPALKSDLGGDCSVNASLQSDQKLNAVANEATARQDAPTESIAEPAGGSFPDPSAVLTQQADHGVRFDFNLGVRVHVPEGTWHIAIKDRHTESTVVEAVLSQSTIMSEKRYYMDARIEVREIGARARMVVHDFNAAGRDVAIILPIGTLGDAIGWLPYAVQFQKVHQCNLFLVVSEPIKALFQRSYPHVKMLTRDAFDPIKDQLYATYYLGLFFHDEEGHMQPNDFRLVGLHRTAGSILGISMDEQPPLIDLGAEGDVRPILEPYVVIASQSSAQCKMWNHPSGWREIVTFLKDNGYRVICIDREPVTGSGRFLNYIPYGSEDETGDRPLTERARWIRHAAFFVGLSSGLSWLAWAVRTPVVMISGFTHPMNEFSTPYRVFNHNVCNSCWHDIRVPFEHKNYTFCPRHHGTDRQFECSVKITPSLVKSVIARLIADQKTPLPYGTMGRAEVPRQQRVDNPFVAFATDGPTCAQDF